MFQQGANLSNERLPQQQQQWSSEEVARFQSALLQYGKDFNKVAQHVNFHFYRYRAFKIIIKFVTILTVTF